MIFKKKTLFNRCFLKTHTTHTHKADDKRQPEKNSLQRKSSKGNKEEKKGNHLI